VATAWMLREMSARGIVPAALLFNRVNPILAQGAAFAGVALLDRFEGDVTQRIPNGVELLVEPAEGRVTILGRIETLQRDEPWPGYDELSVEDIRAALDAADASRLRQVREYERSHKGRSGVLELADRELASSSPR